MKTYYPKEYFKRVGYNANDEIDNSQSKAGLEQQREYNDNDNNK